MMRISAVCCDITKLSVDAIVNAANKTLLGGGFSSAMLQIYQAIL